MKALVLNSSGSVDNFQLTEMEKPTAAEGQVIIEVHASSVNQIDIKIREGLPIGPELPSPLGCDMAGVVTEVGPGVKNVKVGDEVYGCVAGVKGLGGTLAESIVADARLIARKPRNLSMKEAAALPLVAITAWEGIERAGLMKGENILVHGGMGGVGHIAIQLAAQKGATVATTVRHKRDDAFLKQCGVSHVIDANSTPVADYTQSITGGKGFDVVFDTIGGKNLDAAFEAIGLNGRAVGIAARSTHDLSPLHAKGASLHVVFMLIPMLHGAGRAEHGRILTELAALVEADQVKPLVDERNFTLAEGGQAQQWLESGQAMGKVVVSVR